MPLKIHPNDVLLEEMLVLLGSGHRSLLEHLAGCTCCRERLRSLPHPQSGVALESFAQTLCFRKPIDDYSESMARSVRVLQSLELSMEKEREEAAALYHELMEYPAGQREFLLRNAARFHTWGVYELLLDRSSEAAVSSPARAEELARFALLLSDHLDTGRYKLEIIEDLRARAWAYIGNSHRLRSDLLQAERAFQTAYLHLKRGTREPLERAIFLDLKASLLRDQRRFDEALRLLKRAASIFTQDGERHRAGRTLVKLSTVHNCAGNFEESIPPLYEALGLIEPAQEPRLLLCAWHNLICGLADLGRYMEAQGLYRKARPFYRDFTDASTQNRRKWVKGKIMHGLGRTHTAESLFLAAREGFVTEDMSYEMALVSLDLAVLYAEQGRTAELKRLAGEMVPIFASRHIHREALVALAFLKQALEAEKVSLEVVAGVASFLRRSQLDPALTFEPPA
jgi:tetratricopeptide (TPR) repeat protein